MLHLWAQGKQFFFFTNAHREEMCLFLEKFLFLGWLLPMCANPLPEHLCPNICLAFASARGDDTQEIKCDGWMCAEDLHGVFTGCIAGRMVFAMLRLLSLAWLWEKHNVEQARQAHVFS